MKTIATAGLLLALLTGALPYQGQTRTKIAVQAGRTLYGNRHAATAPRASPSNRKASPATSSVRDSTLSTCAGTASGSPACATP